GSMTTTVTNIETFIVSLPRDVPYLGPLAANETVNAKGYFVRQSNRTVYPTSDVSVLVKAIASDGTIGWGETYGIAAPQAVVDLHWKFNARAALALVRELAPYYPRFIEAPCAPEDISGLAEVTAASAVPIAVGEEWRNIYEAKLRFDNARIGIVQPEIAHTGVTQFVAIARAAKAHHAAVV